MWKCFNIYFHTHDLSNILTMEYENEINFVTNSKIDMSKWTYSFNIVLNFFTLCKIHIKNEFFCEKDIY
jgi:hypothetical protein